MPHGETRRDHALELRHVICLRLRCLQPLPAQILGQMTSKTRSSTAPLSIKASTGEMPPAAAIVMAACTSESSTPVARALDWRMEIMIV
jgi:hypothetical protein